MIGYVKQIIRGLVPSKMLGWYHWVLARFATLYFGYPSEKLIVIGVTGTKGKSTTANLIAQLLEMQGEKVGLTSTATMKVAEREWLSTRKMTMPGRFELQRLLRQMVDAGCTYAVIETSSEGLAQFRSVGIHYDVAVLTNFTPEHIEAHGGYEQYRAAKGILFQQLADAKVKKLNGRNILKRVIINPTISEYDFFSKFQAGEEWQFSFGSGTEDDDVSSLTVAVLAENSSFLRLQILGRELEVPLLFSFNALNVVAAVSACAAVGVSLDDILVKVPALRPVPGRQEFIEEGQRFEVMVDYTYEPRSMELMYKGLESIGHGRIIHVFGATGGGRDEWRRPVMGEIAARNAQVVIITMDDPYDDEPDVIANQILEGARRAMEETGKQTEIMYVRDRQAAIRRALELARPGDLVLITGKGAEQKMALQHGTYIDWDDRAVVREELKRLKQ